MATNSEPCGICFNSFNDADHKAVTLPCDHSFCLTCIVQLKTSGSQNCPVCRQDWSHFEIETLAGMEVLGNISTTGLPEKKTGEDCSTIKKASKEVDVMCEEHSHSWIFWCDNCKQFLCKRCILDKHMTCSCSLIEDVIPSIRANICTTAASVICDLQQEAEQMKKSHDRAIKALSSLAKLKDIIARKEAELMAFVENCKNVIAKNIDDNNVVQEAVVKSEQINSACDVALMKECLQISKKRPRKSAMPSQEGSQSLLCDMASSYMDEAVQCLQENDTKRVAFTSRLQLYAATSLKTGGDWLVDNKNWLPALCSLATRQPSHITLVAIEDCTEPVPVAAIAGAARDCTVTIRFLDSFFCPQGAGTDAARLDCFLANASLTLQQFHGHLNEPEIARLPHSITHLGLAIGSAADAKVVSSLAVWEGLRWLDVAVSSTVAPQDLLPLPTVKYTKLYFYGLTDTRVDSVRPAIEALLPDKREHVLHLPKCQLTAEGALRLAGLLRDAGIRCVRIDSFCSEQRDRETVEAALREAWVRSVTVV